jgi:hypothetical protein
MPSGEDKVVLQIKLELKELKESFLKLNKSVQQYGNISENVKKKSNKFHTVEKKHLKELGTAHLANSKIINKAETDRAKINRGISQSIGQQTQGLKAQQKIIGKIASSIGGSGPSNNPPGGGGGGTYLGRLNRSGGSRIARGALGLGLGLGGGILGFLMGGISNAYAAHQRLGLAEFGLTGMGTRKQYAQGKRAAGKGGVAFGFSAAETAQQAAGVGRSTGSIGDVYRAQQFARAGGGMDVGEATGIMGAFRQGGMTFGGKSGPKALAEMIKLGMTSGLERARLPEYLHSVAEVTEQVGSRTIGDVDIKGIAKNLAFLGKETGMGAGHRTAALASHLDQAIRAPGGGEAGQAMVLRAMGFGKPEGNVGYYDALKKQQRGFQGTGGAQNLLDLFQQTYSEFGKVGEGGSSNKQQMANLAFQQMAPGLTLDQIEKLGDIYNDSTKTMDEKLKLIEDEMKKAAPLEKQALDATKGGFQGVKAHLAGIENQMAGLGGQIAKELNKIQKEQMKWMVAGWPLVLDAMRAISENLPKITSAIEWLRDNWPWGDKKGRELGKVWSGNDVQKEQQYQKDMGTAKTFGDLRTRLQRMKDAREHTLIGEGKKIDAQIEKAKSERSYAISNRDNDERIAKDKEIANLVTKKNQNLKDIDLNKKNEALRQLDLASGGIIGHAGKFISKETFGVFEKLKKNPTDENMKAMRAALQADKGKQEELEKIQREAGQKATQEARNQAANSKQLMGTATRMFGGDPSAEASLAPPGGSVSSGDARLRPVVVARSDMHGMPMSGATVPTGNA